MGTVGWGAGRAAERDNPCKFLGTPTTIPATALEPWDRVGPLPNLHERLLSDYCVRTGTQWCFIPMPSCPRTPACGAMTRSHMEPNVRTTC